MERMSAATNAFSSLLGMPFSSMTVGRRRMASSGVEAVVLKMAPFSPRARLVILTLRAAPMFAVSLRA